jgi:hypothetical protein
MTRGTTVSAPAKDVAVLERAYRLEQAEVEDLLRAAELEVQYAELGLGLVDA